MLRQKFYLTPFSRYFTNEMSVDYIDPSVSPNVEDFWKGPIYATSN